MKVIGVTGTNASGKDAVAEYLNKKYGYKNYSLSNEIRFELTKLGLEHSRENLIMKGNQIRENFDANELAIRAINRIISDGISEVIVTSIRNPAEIIELKNNFKDFRMIFVDAPVAIRYERSQKRGRMGDGESLEEFIEKESRELDAGEKGQRLIACSKLADFKISNDKDLKHLEDEIEKIISQI
ncbi:MAG: AAA family ATPase [bacterium]